MTAYVSILTWVPAHLLVASCVTKLSRTVVLDADNVADVGLVEQLAAQIIRAISCRAATARDVRYAHGECQTP